MTELAPDLLVIGMGGNQGNVHASFAMARSELSVLGKLRSAPLYRSAPIGPAQADFLNTAICVACSSLTADEVLALVLDLERRLGRDRTTEQRWAARPIDLDILLWGQRTIRTPALVVPHPRLTERRFVIEPLRALFGQQLRIGSKSLADWALDVASQRVEWVSATW